MTAFAEALADATPNQRRRLSFITGFAQDRLYHLAQRSGGRDIAPWLKREISAELGISERELFSGSAR